MESDEMAEMMDGPLTLGEEWKQLIETEEQIVTSGLRKTAEEHKMEEIDIGPFEPYQKELIAYRKQALPSDEFKNACQEALKDYHLYRTFPEYAGYLQQYGYASVATYLCGKVDMSKETQRNYKKVFSKICLRAVALKACELTSFIVQACGKHYFQAMEEPSQHTILMYSATLKAFLKWLYGKQCKLHLGKGITKASKIILTVEDYIKGIKAALHYNFMLGIALYLQYNLGCRAQSLVGIQFGDFERVKGRAYVTFHAGKTGKSAQREIDTEFHDLVTWIREVRLSLLPQNKQVCNYLLGTNKQDTYWGWIEKFKVVEPSFKELNFTSHDARRLKLRTITGDDTFLLAQKEAQHASSGTTLNYLSSSYKNIPFSMIRDVVEVCKVHYKGNTTYSSKPMQEVPVKEKQTLKSQSKGKTQKSVLGKRVLRSTHKKKEKKKKRQKRL